MPANDHPFELSRNPRFHALRDWLNLHNATCCWQHDVKSPETTWLHSRITARVECWRVGAGLAIVTLNEHGWSIFTEPNTGEIAATLADAERRLGIAPTHELQIKPLGYYACTCGAKFETDKDAAQHFAAGTKAGS